MYSRLKLCIELELAIKKIIRDAFLLARTTPIYREHRFYKMYRQFEFLVVGLVLSFVLIVGTATTIFFIQLEQETVSNKVAALLAERQQILENVQVTHGVETHYKSLLDIKPQNHRDFLKSIYNY